MNALVWPMVFGLFIGLAVATLILYRFPVSHQLQAARTAPADTYQGYLWERLSLDGERQSR
jgi:hypothetical protein